MACIAMASRVEHHIVMAHIVTIYVLMAETAMACLYDKPRASDAVVRYVVMVYVVMAEMVMAYVVMAYVVMAEMVTAYVVMACL